MKEQLFIIKDGCRYELDINTPSGITLNYKSNLFGDLSKITCSYSYTFKLPITLKNRQVLDNAEDIRATSGMVRKRLKAEFYQNGVMLFRNANLYLDSVESGYNAVLTWDVVDGFERLKDDDISIRELPPIYNDIRDQEKFPVFGADIQEFSAFSNTAEFLQPYYNAGLPFFQMEEEIGQGLESTLYPLPVVPIYRLIERINSHFGTRFLFGEPYAANNHSTANGWVDNGVDSLINRGVVPLVNAEQSEEQIEYNSLGFGVISYGGGTVKYCSVDHCLTVNNAVSDELTSFTTAKNTVVTVMQVDYSGGLKFELDGIIKMELESVAADDTPKFSIYEKVWNQDKANEVASVEGIKEFGSNVWTFDFRASNGKKRMAFSYYLFREGVGFGNDTYENKFFFAMSHKVKSIDGSTNMRLYRMYVADELYSMVWFGGGKSKFPIDLNMNLPDIGCMEFMKSLFFMIGAFPSVDETGNIIPIYYTRIRENVESGNILDWSSRLMSAASSLPSKIQYAVSGYARDNLFMMKSDNEEEQPEEDSSTDIFASGRGVIKVENEVLERRKTIIQLPFYPPYIKDKNWPAVKVGDTTFWHYEDSGSVSCQEANPVVGLIEPFQRKIATGDVGNPIMKMNVWNGFASIQDNSSYSYLQQILSTPIIITETLNLNEFDLRDIDYSVPVYLNKYNSYFAIVSMTRDSNGKCKCELIKLP